MKYVCLAALFFLTACSEPAWQTYLIDQHLSVELPNTPQAIDLDSAGVNKVLKYKSLSPFKALAVSNGDGVYQYLIVINSATVIDEVSKNSVRDSLYNAGIAATLQVNRGGRLLSRTAFSTPAGNGVAVAIEVTSPTTGRHKVLYNRTLLAYHKTYAFTFSTPFGRDTTGSAIQYRRFFNSITVKP